MSTRWHPSMEQKQSAKDAWIKGMTPWLVAVAAFIVYVLTLNRWVTLASIPLASKITGWDWWSTTVQAPLALVLTYPFRFAPASMQPVLLNLFSAVCASGALGLLAKAVSLLPHDRTRDQRHRERSEFSLLSIPTAWVPPVLAAGALGFQLTYWEHAIAITGESLNLLLFAFVIFSLLQYRIDQRPWRLSAMALVYGLAMTNNWAMVGFLPLFVGALVWMLGFRFFKPEVLGRLAIWGALGLLLYLFLPLVESTSGSNDMSFLDLLKFEVGLQKNILLNFPRYLVFLCGLYSLLPVFVLGFRWPSTLGDTSIVGSLLTHWMFRIVNTVFLVVCVWVMFDPIFSPRSKVAGVPFLTFYFLTALSIGYYSGYFMLVFGTEPVRSHHRSSGDRNIIGMAVIGTVCLAMVAVPAGLIYKNLPAIQAANGLQLKKLAETIAQGLPAKGGIAVSDDSSLLILVEAALKTANPKHSQVLVDTRFLSYPGYQRLLLKRNPSVWPDYFATNSQLDRIEQTDLRLMMRYLSYKRDVNYVHPPFGHFGEAIYPIPHGMVYSMKPYLTNEFTNIPLTEEEVADNMEFWTKTKAELATWPKTAPRSEQESVITDAEYARKQFSKAANLTGTIFQKEGHLNEAGFCFDLALEFNPDNDVAKVNRDYHLTLKAGNPKPVEMLPAVEDKIRAKYVRWEDRIRENGPYDEPYFCGQTGEHFALSSLQLTRQAAQCFMRAQQLDPSKMDYRIWLGNMFLKANAPSHTLETISRINATNQSFDVKIELILMEAWAHAFQTNLPYAEKLLLSAQQKYPDVESLPENLSKIYIQNGMFTNALAAVDRQLQIAPNNIKALLNKGALCIQLTNYVMAVQSLNRVIAAEPKNDAARVDRAIALMQSGQWDAAKADYEILLDLVPHFYRAYYGLGQIAYLKKDARTAIKNFELYLKYAPRDMKGKPLDVKEAQSVTQKLQGLQSGAAAP